MGMINHLKVEGPRPRDLQSNPLDLGVKLEIS